MNTPVKYLRALACMALVLSAAELAAQTDAAAAKSEVPAQTNRTKIGIMKFDVGEGMKKDLGVLLYNGLMDRLVNSRQFTVVDWEEIDRVLGYLAKSQPAMSPDEARKQAGHQLGLEKMIVGIISKVADKYYFSTKVLTLDLSVERVERLSADKEDGLEACGDQMGRLLLVSPEEAKQLRAEYDAWSTLQSGKSEAALKQFLETFPKSVHAKEAEEVYQKLRADRTDRENKQEAARQAEAQQREKSARLRADIAGAWQIESETYPAGKTTVVDITGIFSGVVNIVQDGKNVTFEARTFTYNGFTGGGSPMSRYKGTYESNTLRATGKGTRLDAVMDESGNKLVGHWTWRSYVGKLQMTRVAADSKP